MIDSTDIPEEDLSDKILEKEDKDLEMLQINNKEYFKNMFK